MVGGHVALENVNGGRVEHDKMMWCGEDQAHVIIIDMCLVSNNHIRSEVDLKQPRPTLTYY